MYIYSYLKLYIHIVKGFNLCIQGQIRRFFVLILFPEDTTIIRLSCVADNLVDGDLITQGAMASAVMASAVT